MRGPLLAIAGVALPTALMLALVYAGGRRVDPPDVCPRGSEKVAPGPQPERSQPETEPAGGGAMFVQPAATRRAEPIATTDGWISGILVRVEGETGYRTARAVALLAARRFDDAVRAFDRLMMDTPEDPEIMLGKGLALTGARRYEDAVPLFERLVELHGSDANTLFNVAAAQLRAGDMDAATETFYRVLRADGQHLKAKYNLAVIHQSRERYAAAIALWRELTDDDVEFERKGEALFHLGECALILRLYPEAVDSFQRVVQADQNDAMGWCNLGIARAAREQHDEAIAALEKALELDQRLVPAMNQLAYVYVNKYRDSHEAEDREAVVRYTTMSLRTFDSQPHIEALRKAVENIDLSREAESPRVP